MGLGLLAINFKINNLNSGLVQIKTFHTALSARLKLRKMKDATI
jgi:hypothetical protein